MKRLVSSRARQEYQAQQELFQRRMAEARQRAAQRRIENDKAADQYVKEVQDLVNLEQGIQAEMEMNNLPRPPRNRSRITK